jgi:hypothetical protein
LRHYEAKQGPNKKRQLVIAVSANFTGSDHIEMIGPGKFDALIPKPISISDIKQAITDYMAGRLPLKFPAEQTEGDVVPVAITM